MIVRDTEREFVMVRQHDHARFSGHVAEAFQPFFRGDSRFEDVLFAVFYHDFAWIRLDETPVWNDRRQMPFSFVDYPLLSKLTHYRHGLDETERLNRYAALLCSMHYASFSVFQGSASPECRAFREYEEERQRRLRMLLGVGERDDALWRQFMLLQLCDRLSLFVCMNEPGFAYADPHWSYRDGFPDSEPFSADRRQRLAASWLNGRDVRLSPNPFEREAVVSLIHKRVNKEKIRELGIGEAYRQAPWRSQQVRFVGGGASSDV